MLNPLPSAVGVANCAAWVAYSFVIDDWYIYVENVLGLLAALFLFLVAFGIGVPDVQQRDLLTAAAMLLAAALPIVAALERLVLESSNARQQLWGFSGTAPACTIVVTGLARVHCPTLCSYACTEC
jgi:cytochrome bd-type quinol oxidase subunit 2